MSCVEWIPFSVVTLVMKKVITTQQTSLTTVYINVDNIETERTGNISGIIRACDTNLSHQN